MEPCKDEEREETNSSKGAWKRNYHEGNRTTTTVKENMKILLKNKQNQKSL